MILYVQTYEIYSLTRSYTLSLAVDTGKAAQDCQESDRLKIESTRGRGLPDARQKTLEPAARRCKRVATSGRNDIYVFVASKWTLQRQRSDSSGTATARLLQVGDCLCLVLSWSERGMPAETGGAC